MELQFSEEQVLLRNTIEKMCVDHSDLSTLRNIEDSNIGYSEDFWNQIINNKNPAYKYQLKRLLKISYLLYNTSDSILDSVSITWDPYLY